jgi:hypothetical protein
VSRIEVDRNNSPEASVHAALTACDAAATIRPDVVYAFAEQASAWVSLAYFQRETGGDPTAAVQEAISRTRAR